MWRRHWGLYSFIKQCLQHLSSLRGRPLKRNKGPWGGDLVLRILCGGCKEGPARKARSGTARRFEKLGLKPHRNTHEPTSSAVINVHLMAETFRRLIWLWTRLSAVFTAERSICFNNLWERWNMNKTCEHRHTSDREWNEVWLLKSAFHLLSYPTEIKTESFGMTAAWQHSSLHIHHRSWIKCWRNKRVLSA